MEDKYLVYIHTCPNSKVYIGITCNKPEYRWGRNGHGYRGQMFHNAIKKYGWDNIKHEIIQDNLTKQEAEELERYLIYICRSSEREFGYNIALGGNAYGKHTEATKEKIRQFNLGKKLSAEHKAKVSEGLKGRPCSEYTRLKISNSNKGKHSHFLGKHHTEETKRKLSTERTGQGNPMYGRQHTEESKRKIREAEMGANNNRARAVVCINNGMEFDYMGAAAQWAGIKNSGEIGNCCRGKKKSAGKHPETGERLRWKYKEE